MDDLRGTTRVHSAETASILEQLCARSRILENAFHLPTIGEMAGSLNGAHDVPGQPPISPQGPCSPAGLSARSASALNEKVDAPTGFSARNASALNEKVDSPVALRSKTFFREDEVKSSLTAATSPSMDQDFTTERALIDRVSAMEQKLAVECDRWKNEFNILAERTNTLVEHLSSKFNEDSLRNTMQKLLKEHHGDIMAALKQSQQDFKQPPAEPNYFLRAGTSSIDGKLDAANDPSVVSTGYPDWPKDDSASLRTRYADSLSLATTKARPDSASADSISKIGMQTSRLEAPQEHSVTFQSGECIRDSEHDMFLPPLLLHFDVNKTVLLSDTVSLKTNEEGIRESISELFWGLSKYEGGTLVWSWTKTAPSCYPPDGFGDCVFEDCQLINYVEFCKKAIKDKASRKAAITSWSLVTEHDTLAQMEKLLKDSVKRLELWSEVRFTKQAVAAGLRGTTLHMFPAIFAFVAFLQRSKRKFSILFRSFGEDHKKISMEWNAFCEMRHPMFSHLLEGIGPLDGSVSGVPDRRIPDVNGFHTLYRDAKGPVLILNTFTNGPSGSSSWDAWAKTKPKPKQDIRKGREYIKDHLKVEFVDGLQNLRTWMHKHTLAERTSAIKDDWAWWHWNGEKVDFGKLMTVTEGRNMIKQIFYDDNIDYHDARIVDCRYTNGECVPLKVAQDKMIVKVNPIEVLSDEDFFIKTVQRLHGDHLSEGYALAFEQFYHAIHEQDTAAHFAGPRGGIQRRRDIFDSPKMLSLLFCHVQMLPRKGTDRYLPLFPNVSAETNLQGEGVTITGVYSTAINVMLKRALIEHQLVLQNQRKLHGALSPRDPVATDSYDEMIRQCRLIMQKAAMAMQRNRQTHIGFLEIPRVLPSELQGTWNALKSCIVGDRMQLLQVSKDATADVHFLVEGMQFFFVASEIALNTNYESLPPLQTLLTDTWWSQMLNILAEAFPESYIQLLENRLAGFEPECQRSFLHIAAAVGHEPVFHLLKLFSPEHQQAIATRETEMLQIPLHVAACHGNDNLCGLMLNCKAGIDALDKEGCWPMHVAMQQAHFETAKMMTSLLLKRRTEIIFPAPEKGSDLDSEDLALRLLSQDRRRVISETEFLEAVKGMFVELRYFDKTGDVVEKKREFGALLAVYWIITDQYDLFVRSQPAANRMTKESWEKLQEWTRKVICLTESPQHVQVMLVFVAIMSVGKIKSFRTAFTPNIQEFGEALVHVLQHQPFVFPSFARLEPTWKQMIISCLMAGGFNFGQFLQAENVPANLLLVKDLVRASILRFFLFRIFAAMCGILGMKTLDGALFMDEKNYQNFKVGLEVLQKLEDESPQKVYNQFLAERARAQGLIFDAENPESRAVVRLACMSRVFDPEGANEVKGAFQRLDSADRNRLMEFLNADGIEVKPAILLYNAPNLLENGRKNKNVGLYHALVQLLRIYDAVAKAFTGVSTSVITVMVDELIPVVTTCTDPDLLPLIAFDVRRPAGEKADTQGVVAVKD